MTTIVQTKTRFFLHKNRNVHLVSSRLDLEDLFLNVAESSEWLRVMLSRMPLGFEARDLRIQEKNLSVSILVRSETANQSNQSITSEIMRENRTCLLVKFTCIFSRKVSLDWSWAFKFFIEPVRPSKSIFLVGLMNRPS